MGALKGRKISELPKRVRTAMIFARIDYDQLLEMERSGTLHTINGVGPRSKAVIKKWCKTTTAKRERAFSGR